MKKLLLFLACLFLPVVVSAANFTCVPSTSCDGTGEVCDWDTAGSWTSCNSTYPHNTGGNAYAANITGSGTFVIDGSAVNPVTIGFAGTTVPLTVVSTATLVFRDNNCAAGCDARKFRHLTIVSPGSATNSITLGGRLVMRAGHRINCDGTNGSCKFFYDDGSVLDARGTIHETTVTGWTEADADTGATGVGTCRASGTLGRRITIGVKSGIEFAKQGRRIVFQSGQMRNRHFEIVAVGAAPDRTIAFCTDYDDTKSANGDCTAASTPWACCTGDATGTCTAGQRLTPFTAVGTFPTERHLVPSYDPNTDICTGAGAPFRCCTGSGAGSCYSEHCVASGIPDACCTGLGTGTCGIRPAVGDLVTIIDDGWFATISGANHFGWTGSASGNSPMPLLYAVNMAGCGDGNVNCFSTIAKADGQQGRPFNFNNINNWGGDPGSIRGMENQEVRWTAIHDAASSAAANAGFVIWETAGGLDVDGANMSDNVAYRNAGNALTISSSGSNIDHQNVRVERNLVYQGCSASNECNGIEINSCQGCSLSYNLVHDIRKADNTVTSGDCLHLDASTPASVSGSYAFSNWVVNCTESGIRSQNGAPAWSQAAATHNYFSHLGKNGGEGGSYYSNVIKNYGMANVSLSDVGIRSPFRAKGNFMYGSDTSVKASGACSAAVCSSAGIYWTTEATANPDNLAVVASDNVVVELDSGAGTGYAVNILGTDTYNITIDHLTFDGKGFDLRGPRINSAPTASVTYTFDDILGMRGNGLIIAGCSSNANIIDNVGALARMNSPYTADSTILLTGTCSSGPTAETPFTEYPFISGSNNNYGISAASSLLSLGTSPPIGSRAFRFDRARLEAVWGKLPFDGGLPANFANGSISNIDTDGDGVMDLHDNCDYNFNPSQIDTDGDGAGDACDP